METIAELTSKYAHQGQVEWIGVRPNRREPLQSVKKTEISLNGLQGDHNQTGGKRAVTLIQYEHFPVIASLLGIPKVKPEQLRRNFVISGINLLGLRNRQFQIGTVIFEGTGLCAPCSRMEEEFGKGGYAAVRGHGGITAKIIKAGIIATGDKLTPQ